MAAREKFRARMSRRRISQRDILGKGIKERHWFTGQVYVVSQVFTFSDAMTLSDGEDNQWTVTYTQTKGFNFIVPEPITSIYVESSVEDSAYELPGGGSIVEQEWHWRPFSWNYYAWKNVAGKARNKATGKIWVHNISAGANKDVTIVQQLKYIAGATGESG